MIRTYSLLVAAIAAATKVQGQDTQLAQVEGCGCGQPSMQQVACLLNSHDDQLCGIEEKCADIQACVDELKGVPAVRTCRVVAFSLVNDGGPLEDFDGLFAETTTIEQILEAIETFYGGIWDPAGTLQYWLENLDS